MGKANGRYCCDCDHCGLSPCDHTPVWAIFLTDYPESSHNYYMFCDAHMGAACDAMIRYIAEHPGVSVDATDGAWDEMFGAFFEQRACNSGGVEIGGGDG